MCCRVSFFYCQSTVGYLLCISHALKLLPITIAPNYSSPFLRACVVSSDSSRPRTKLLGTPHLPLSGLHLHHLSQSIPCTHTQTIMTIPPTLFVTPSASSALPHRLRSTTIQTSSVTATPVSVGRTLFNVRPRCITHIPLLSNGRGSDGGAGKSPGRGWSHNDDNHDDDEDAYLAMQTSSVVGTTLYLLSRRYYRRNSPWVTQQNRTPPTLQSLFRDIRISHVLLLANVLVFLLQLARGPSLLMAGAKVNSAISAGQYYRLFSPMFFHGSMSHLLINSFSLQSTGPSVESWFGKRRFLALYLLSGICGNTLSFLCTPAPAVGASGAIFGLVGATAVLLSRHRRLLGPRARRGLQSLVYVVIMNFGFGLTPGSQVDNFGHLGGLLGGVAFAYLLGPRLVVSRVSNGRTQVRDEPLIQLVLRDLQLRAQQLRKALRGR